MWSVVKSGADGPRVAVQIDMTHAPVKRLGRFICFASTDDAEQDNNDDNNDDNDCSSSVLCASGISDSC
ncbi:hypothetical protein [Paraburkholderia fungorum]|uniref:Uncharacterized protein n=1 Tax=Paraburkholderia fungorum TaxID=134537 RepID=A0A420GUE8_9BURK|nr:hypothetical protein [Paraburkholderia fungorum]RKF48810.1 hypothetical protein BCY88_19435 [Paraburkholderia fungorum]